MTERSITRRLPSFPRIPLVARAVALVLLLASAASIGIYLYQHQPPPPARPDDPVLGGEVTAIFENYKHLEVQGEVSKFLLTAALAKAYANGAHELETVEIAFFAPDGSVRNRVNADHTIYDQKVATVVMRSNVKVATAEGLEVTADEMRFNQETNILELSGPVAYKQPNVEGTCRDATVEMDINRLAMHHDVDMTFKSSDDAKPADGAAAKPAVDPAAKAARKAARKAKRLADGKPAKGGDKGKKEGGGRGGGDGSAIDFAKGPRIPVHIRSGSAVFDKASQTARYDGGAIATREKDELRGASLVAFLDENNRFDSIEARGSAMLRAAGRAEVTAPSLDFDFAEGNQLEKAVATGGSRIVSLGDPPTRTVTGDRTEIDFAPGAAGSEIRQARVNGQAVVLIDAPAASATAPNPATRELKADAVTLDMLDGGQFAKSVDANGNAILTITPVNAVAGADRKRIAAPTMRMEFFESNNAAREFSATGGTRMDIEPMTADGRQTRTTTSEAARAEFVRDSQDISRVDHNGNFTYVEGDRNATADRAAYTLSDELIALRGESSNGRPMVWDSKSRSQATEIDIRTKARTSAARGDVRTTYYSPESAGRATPFGKTKSPVFITAKNADVREADGGVAVYTGAARAWQDDNYVKGDTITLHSADRRMEAQGNVESGFTRASRRSATGDAAESVPVFTTASSMDYSDTESKVRYQGSVVTRQAPGEIRSDVQDVWLTKSEATSNVDRMIATGSVVMTEPGRNGRGDKLVYTASDQRAVLTGANARLEDAEQGTTTGQELTYFVGGERVRVAGRSGTGRVKSTHKVGKGGT